METITSAWLEIVNGVDRTAERLHRALVGTVSAGDFILMPFGSGKFFQDCVDPGSQRRRSHRFGEDPQAVAFLENRLFAPSRYVGLKPNPGVDVPLLGHGLRAVRIVHRQDGGLLEVIRSAQAARMIGIAFNLGGPAQVAGDTKPVPTPPICIAVAKYSGTPGTNSSGWRT